MPAPAGNDLDRIDLDDLDGLPAELAGDLADAAETAAAALAPNTRASYARGWADWCAYADRNGLVELPAHGVAVAGWAKHLAKRGLTAGSVGVRLAAVSYEHRQTTDEHGDPLADPTKHAACRKVMAGLRRAAAGRPQRQAKPLTAEAMAAVRATLRRRRPVGGGRVETQANAERRACRDLALLMLMRDALLRRSEAAALRWCDLELGRDDGTGRVVVRRSKTDPTGEGAALYVGRAAVDALRAWAQHHDDPTGERSLFDLTGSQIGRVVTRACRDAFDGDAAAGWSSHSARVGMAVDLVAANTELPAVQVAGRWSSPTMPARYARAELAGRGAVARFYDRTGG